MGLEWIPSEMIFFDCPVSECEFNVFDQIDQLLLLLIIFFLHSTNRIFGLAHSMFVQFCVIIISCNSFNSASVDQITKDIRIQCNVTHGTDICIFLSYFAIHKRCYCG